MDIITNLDIFFTVLMTAVYIAFTFYAKTTDSKFIVFFISSFINIFNYSITLKNEINFLSIVLLNLFFILTMVFFYIYLDVNDNFLPSDYVESSDLKNIITILIFFLSFLAIASIFYSLNKDKSLFFNQKLNNSVIISENNDYYSDYNGKQKKNEIQIDNTKYIIYNRKLNFIENNYFFKHYNLMILLYVVILVVTFIINNAAKDER